MKRSEVSAPSRLHFGLWSLGGAGGKQFGGVGAMIDAPVLRLVAQEAPTFSVTGPGAERARSFARRWAAFHERELPACQIEVVSAIANHVGLGSGTQLALAVAGVLSRFVGLREQTPQDLAQSVGRGLRSAVGTYGFAYGGLIVESGKQAAEPVSPLDCRLDLPHDWRFVLATPRGLAGLAGIEEAMAFQNLPAVPESVTERLMCLARERMLPAVVGHDFDVFSDSVHEYGRLSGECFAVCQGGPYNGPVITGLIEWILARGHRGVGQSSWGPLVYVALPTEQAAAELAEWLASTAPTPVHVQIAKPANQGAVFTGMSPVAMN